MISLKNISRHLSGEKIEKLHDHDSEVYFLLIDSFLNRTTIIEEKRSDLLFLEQMIKFNGFSGKY